MQLLTGKEVSEAVYDDLKKKCLDFTQTYGIAPTLAVILVGDDPASQSYVNSKRKACIALGFGHRDYHLDADTTEEQLLGLVRTLNADPLVHGILVQMPLPPGLDEHKVIETIDSRKDVDGFHPENVGKLLIGLPCFVSCTPQGVLAMLDYYKIETKGKQAVILGRSNIVGKPMAALLMQKGRDATVTVCHSRTEDLETITRQADILIAAIGKPLFVTRDMVKPGAVVIDVGINRIEDQSRKRGYRLVGDVDFEQVKEVCSAITPVPKGVGVMTIAMLMKNTMQAATRLAREDTV